MEWAKVEGSARLEYAAIESDSTKGSWGELTLKSYPLTSARSPGRVCRAASAHEHTHTHTQRYNLFLCTYVSFT